MPSAKAEVNLDELIQGLAMPTTKIKANLDTLPNELIDQICSYFPFRGVLRFSEQRRHKRDFLSLRATCTRLRLATDYQFGLRFLMESNMYRSPSFKLSSKDLVMLLNFSNRPEIRDRILCFQIVCEDRSTWQWNNNATRYMNAVNRTRYAHSVEVFHLLERIFSNFQDSRNLQAIVVTKGFFPIIFDALQASGLQQQLYELRNSAILRFGYPGPYHSYPVLICLPGPASPHSIVLSGHEQSVSLSGVQLAQNRKELVIQGCKGRDPKADQNENCRFCHSMFSKDIYRNFHPQLRTLRIQGLFVNAFSLASFIGRHEQTLTAIKLSDVYLTPGSWYNVFIKLRRVSGLKQLHLKDLFESMELYMRERKEISEDFFKYVTPPAGNMDILIEGFVWYLDHLKECLGVDEFSSGQMTLENVVLERV